MNSSKKIKIKKSKEEKKVVNNVPKPLIYVSAVLVFILIVAVAFDQLYERIILSINGEKYKMDDLTYYFYTVESQYESMNQMFGGYWDMSIDETSGSTVRDLAKQEAIEAALYTEILYKEAVSKGYSLTEDEKTTLNTNVDNLINNVIPKAVAEKNGFDKEYLTDILGKSMLVQRFKEDQIATLDIDEEAIKAGIEYEDYRQYDIEYLFIGKTKADDDGNTVDLTEEEKAAAKARLTGLIEQAKTTEDWSTLVPEDDTELIYQKNYFTKSDSKFNDDFKAVMMAMNNGDISDVSETENGWYLVRMINNNSSESYDKEVESQINSAEEEGFQTIYQDIAAKYKYKVNKSALKSLTMGNITLVN